MVGDFRTATQGAWFVRTGARADEALVNVLLAAAAAMLAAATPLGIVLWRGPTTAALVAYEVLSVLTVMVVVLMPGGFGHAAQFEAPAVLAFVLFGGGLVFARALERQP